MNIAVLILALMGIFVAVAGGITLLCGMKGRKTCKCKTKGVLTDSKRLRNMNTKEVYYYGIYEYNYQGQTYSVTSTVGTSYRPRAGKKKTIYFNPENPQECVTDTGVVALVAGILLGIGGLLIIIAMAILIASL